MTRYMYAAINICRRFEELDHATVAVCVYINNYFPELDHDNIEVVGIEYHYNEQ